MNAVVNAPDGVLVIDKPTGMTSHDVVAKVRRLVGSKPGRRGNRKGPKVGHTGTLDPDASGVLVVCIGKATRLVQYLQASRKTYDATMRLGRQTTTLDAEGEETARTDASSVTEAALCQTMTQFVGDIEQIPPMVSAIKIGGERLHEKARRGEVVDRPPRPVTIHEIMLADFQPGEQAYASFLVTCSAGTYIRTLAADVGDSLGVGAHLTALRRMGSGRFSIADAVTLEQLHERAETVGSFDDVLLTPAQAMADFRQLVVTDEVAKALSLGRPVPSTGEPGTVAVLNTTGDLLAVITDDGRRTKSEVVLHAV